MMKYKLGILSGIIIIGATALATQQTEPELNPGIDRWAIKTKVEKIATKPKVAPLKKLLTLPLLPEKYSTDEYSNKLIPETVAKDLKEGMIVTTTGYIQLVALEKDKEKKDGDYHIQMTLKQKWGDSCFIVEIPYPEFITNATLKILCEKNRDYIRKNIFKNEKMDPSSGGKSVEKGVYVRVTGQLFYDAHHAGEMRNPDKLKRKYRGKQGDGPSEMHSYTAWEIHPVTNIEPAKP